MYVYVHVSKHVCAELSVAFCLLLVLLFDQFTTTHPMQAKKEQEAERESAARAKAALAAQANKPYVACMCMHDVFPFLCSVVPSITEITDDDEPAASMV
jgi:hypothetical protein